MLSRRENSADRAGEEGACAGDGGAVLGSAASAATTADERGWAGRRCWMRKMTLGPV